MVDLETPIDEMTRLPLPLIPVDNPRYPDWHHHFHPKRSSFLQGVGGRAVRNARLQKFDYAVHHYDYHGNYLGPPLPETIEEQFSAVIMSVAGFIPEHGIAFQGHEPRIAKLSPELRHRLQTSGEIKIGSIDVVRQFLRSYVLSRDIAEINTNELTIEEFITTKDSERRRVLGHNLLGLITNVATEHVDETYHQARQKELILPGLPGNIRRFTKSSLGSIGMRDRLVKDLHARLAA